MNKTELLLQTVDDVTFYNDTDNKEVFYAKFQNNDGISEFSPIDSVAFKSYLFAVSRQLTNGEAELDPDSSIKKLRYLLTFEKEYKIAKVFVRTSGNLSDGIEYDPQNDSQDTIKITANGWRISPKKRRFVVPDIALPQVYPVKTSKSPLELLKPFVNIQGDTFTLFVIWLIQAFSCGTHYAPLIYADKGCGKSTLSKIIKRIIDPCNFQVTTIPDKKSDLAVLLYNSWLCCFDNVTNISNDVSDIFCGAITGTSITKRALYSDNQLSVETLHNTIVINGIGVTPTRDDLAERMILIRLQKIPSTKRLTDKELWQNFEAALPEILGAIFNTLSLAMQEIQKSQTSDISRIGDAFVEMLAIAKALGISEEKFRQIFNDNVEALKQARASSPLVEAIKEFMSTVSSRKYQGKADNVLSKIRENFSGDKSLLPNSASHLTRRIEQEHEKLLTSGFRVNIDDTGANGTEVCIIKRKK